MKKNSKTRIEKDSMGQIKVPAESYYGAFTMRAHKNFRISGMTAPKIFIEALGLIKLAAAETNGHLKTLSKTQSNAIIKACKEFIDGKFDSEFIVDTFQAGAGTSYNMNANEIIANRANEIMGGKKGEYKFIHPNNHVNQSQSTNDVIPTTLKVATLLSLPALLAEIKNLEDSFTKKATQYSKALKVGRTHLQDAVAITFGQEFDSYKEALMKSRNFIMDLAQELQVLGIGGTAVGTGINTDPRYKDMMVKNLTKLIGIEFKSGKNLTEMANNMNSFLNFSAGLRSLAVNLQNICSDLKLMNMGPKAGPNEIDLPAVQPGSSIMPGKINPSVPEAVEMVAMQVMGNDKTIELACSRSNFELNVFCPIITHNLLSSMEILKNAIRTLREFCVEGIRVNTEHVTHTFEHSLTSATALTPYIGYEETSKIVKTALKNKTSIRHEVLKNKLLSPKNLNTILSVENTTHPSKLKKLK